MRNFQNILEYVNIHLLQESSKMGRRYKFIPAKTLDLIIELRQQKKSFMCIAEELDINPQRIAVICRNAGIDEEKEYRERTFKKKEIKGHRTVTSCTYKPSTKKKLRAFFYRKNIISTYLISDSITNISIRTYQRPLLKH